MLRLRLAFVALSFCVLPFLVACPPMAPNSNDNAPSNDNSSVNSNQSDNANANGDSDALTFVEPKSVAAQVAFPTGAAVDVSTLSVSTILGDAPVAADGSAAPRVTTGTPSLATVVEPGGKVVLLGFLASDGSRSEIGARSTAEALLFFSAGGFGLPAQAIDELLQLIRASAAADGLTSAIEQALALNPTAITDGGAELEAAIAAAHQALVTETNQAGGVPLPRAATGGIGAEDESGDGASARKFGPRAQAGDGLPILLTPDAGAIQSGVQVLQNDQGAGIFGQNNFRRRATMFVYQVSSLPEGATMSTEINPPVQIGGPIEIPSTVRLSALGALGSVTGSVPWAPVRSDAIDLPMVAGSTRTNYRIVVVGPSLGGITGAAFNGPRLAPFHPTWNAKIDDLQYEMMLWDFVIPIVEFLSVGVGTSVSVGVRAGSIASFRAILDPELAAAGIALDITRSAGLRTFLQSLLRDLADPARRGYAQRLLTNILINDAELAARSISLQQMERGLFRALAARSVLVAIDVALGALDGNAVLSDLSRSSRDETWDATVIQRRVRLTPPSATLSASSPSALFTASVNGLPNETFLYRWRTSGQQGRIFDAFDHEGAAFDSPDPSVQFIASNPSSIPAGPLDTVTVEVFEDNDANVIPAGATPIGSATATLRGRDPSQCELLDIVTRPRTSLIRLAMPQTVRRGDRLEIEITIDGPAIEAIAGRQTAVTVSLFSVSGAYDVVAPANQQQILLDGNPIVGAGGSGNFSLGEVGTVISTPRSVSAYNGLIISGGNFIPFHTRNALTHTISVPISTQARFICSEFRAPFVLVSMSFVGSGLSAETTVFEQFVMTD